MLEYVNRRIDIHAFLLFSQMLWPYGGHWKLCLIDPCKELGFNPSFVVSDNLFFLWKTMATNG